MINWIRRSLTKKMILGFLGVAILPLAIMTTLYFQTLMSMLINDTRQDLAIGAQQTAQALDAFFEENVVNLRTQGQFNDIVAYLQTDAPNRYLHDARISNLFRSMSRANNSGYLQSYLLLDENGKVVYDQTQLNANEDFSEEEFFTNTWQAQTPQVTLTPEDERGDRGIYFSAQVWNDRGEKIGVLAVRYNFGVIQFITGESESLAGSNTFAVVAQEDGQVLSWNTEPSPSQETLRLADFEKQSLARDVSLNGENYAAVYFPLENVPLHVFYLKTEASISNFIRNQRFIVAIISMSIITLTSGLAILVASRTMKPIKALTATSMALSAGDWSARVAEGSVDEVGQMAATFNQMADQIVSEFEALESSYLQAVLALAQATDVRDAYTGNHSHDMAEWAAATARNLGCAEKEIKTIHWAGLLHDIGKISVPDKILHKPGALIEEEWSIMKNHPRIGADIIALIDNLHDVAELVHAHHERFDGSGYPRGVQGNDIPLGARIIAVVDAYSAITDERVYNAARPHAEAIAELKRCAGTDFDPQVVEAFIDMLDQAGG